MLKNALWRGFIILGFLLVALIAIKLISSTFLEPLFVNPIERALLNSALADFSNKFWLKALSFILGIMGFIAVVTVVGLLSIGNFVSRLFSRFPWLAKIPLLKKLADIWFMKIFEWKTGLHARYVIEMEDRLFYSGGKIIGIVTNESTKEDGRVFCNVFLPTAISIWTGNLLKDVPKDSFRILDGATLSECTIFFGSFGANDPLHRH